MIDPHVEKLYYKVVTREHTDYDKAAPLEEKTDDFMMTLQGVKAVFFMKKHFSTEQEARAVVDEYIKRWEILIGIEHGPDELKLIFEKSDIIDRAPTPERKGGLTIHVKNGIHVVTGSDVKLHLSRSKYPTLPKQFSLSLDVETMYFRYKAYKENRETLPSMAYMCLTVLETSAGGRKEAATCYHIHEEVLNKLGELCSTKGTKEEIRKAPKTGQFIPLSSTERAWIETVIKSLIRRAGEWAYDPTADLKKIRMADLPTLI
jgi:uncharacterized protein YheU (UPF0270 family)